MERREETMGTRDIASAPETNDARDEEIDGGGAATVEDPEHAPLLPENESADFGRRWEEIQTAFVDEPQRAVEEADQLVASVMQRLADGFARERERLEGHWSRGEDVSTEDLRVTLQRYRSFFRRLLSA
jgi:hypothetical protein